MRGRWQDLDATAVIRGGTLDGATLDPQWFIWGPFGGYLAAIAMRAMAARSMHRWPATFSCQYLNVGVAGPVDIDVVPVKSGKRAECLRAGVHQGGKLLLEAQSWIVADDLTGIEHDDGPITGVCRPSQLAEWNGYGDQEGNSPIWTHIIRQPLEGSRSAGTADAKARWSCWLRLAELFPADEPALQAARALLWMDMAPWNAALMVHGWPTTHLAPTLDLTVQFQPHLYAPDVRPSDWLLAETWSPAAARGLFGAHSKLWSEAGRLVAIGAAQALCVPNPRYHDQMRQLGRSIAP